MKLRAVLVTNIPRPYRIPFFNELARRLTGGGADFTVVFYSRPQRHRRRRSVQLDLDTARFDWVETSNLDVPLGGERVLTLPHGMGGELKRLRPDVLVIGGFSPSSLAAWAYAKTRRVPYIVWSGDIASSREAHSSLRRRCRRMMAGGATAGIAYGGLAKEYLESLAPRLEVFEATNTVDTQFFADTAKNLGARGSELRESWGFARRNVLCVGQLVARKGVEQLLDAVQLVRRDVPGLMVHLVGSGPLESPLKDKAEQMGLTENVRFWGFRQQDDVALFYALCDVLVFPSLFDIWGLVLNEALACGLPVIASTHAGATADLVSDGVNGFAVDPRDVGAMAERIRRILTDARLRGRMSRAATDKVREAATIERSADGFLRAIELALDSSRH